MRKLLLLMTVTLCMVLAGCGASREATHNIAEFQTQVVLQKKNFKVIGTVSGKSEQTYVFGIGGLSKKSMTESAMSEMMKRADLMDGSRAIINVNVQYKSKCVLGFVYNKVTAIATGTIIEFTE